MAQVILNRDFLVPTTVTAVISAIATAVVDKLTSLSLLNAVGVVAVPSAALAFGAYWLWMTRRVQAHPSTSRWIPPQPQLRLAAPGAATPLIRVNARLDDKRLGAALQDVGLSAVTEKLADSPFTPEACMASTTHSLMFMGVLGSKWVNDPSVRASFVEFLRKIERCHGAVKFCLVDPKGQGYARLHGYRDGKISTESVDRFKELSDRFKCLEVRFYDQLPSFRLIFIDAGVCVVARYKIDQAGYFMSRQGWDAPHLCFSAQAPWSLYEPFETYFNEFWALSRDINDVLKEPA